MRIARKYRRGSWEFLGTSGTAGPCASFFHTSTDLETWPIPEYSCLVMSEKLEGWTEVFAALGNPERLRIVAYLLSYRRGNCAELAKAVNLSTPALSYHLRLLEGAGLITRERQGRRQCVRASPELRRILRPAVLEDLRKEGA